eukprot:s434_g14.t1
MRSLRIPSNQDPILQLVQEVQAQTRSGHWPNELREAHWPSLQERVPRGWRPSRAQEGESEEGLRPLLIDISEPSVSVEKVAASYSRWENDKMHDYVRYCTIDFRTINQQPSAFQSISYQLPAEKLPSCAIFVHSASLRGGP